VSQEEVGRQLDHRGGPFQAFPAQPNEPTKPRGENPQQDRPDPHAGGAPPSLALLDTVQTARLEAGAESPPPADKEGEGDCDGGGEKNRSDGVAEKQEERWGEGKSWDEEE
jgi:hypothetical protein